MDDLKLFASNDNQLRSLINVTKTFSDDIRMSFCMNKCNKITIVRGKVVHHQTDITLNTGEVLTSLEKEQQYRYLSFNERETTDKTTKSTIKNEYFKRIKMIMKSELSSQNSINAINWHTVSQYLTGRWLNSRLLTERRGRCSNNTTQCTSKATRPVFISPKTRWSRSQQYLWPLQKRHHQIWCLYSEKYTWMNNKKKTRIKGKRVTIQSAKLSTKELHGQHARLL